MYCRPLYWQAGCLTSLATTTFPTLWPAVFSLLLVSFLLVCFVSFASAESAHDVVRSIVIILRSNLWNIRIFDIFGDHCWDISAVPTCNFVQVLCSQVNTVRLTRHCNAHDGFQLWHDMTQSQHVRLCVWLLWSTPALVRDDCLKCVQNYFWYEHWINT